MATIARPGSSSPITTAQSPTGARTPNLSASERRRRSHSTSSVRFPATAITRASSTATVVLPSFGTELVTTIVRIGLSKLMNPKFAYSVLIALRCSGRGSSAFRTLVFFLNIFIIDSPVRAGGSPARPPRVAYAPSNFLPHPQHGFIYEAVLRIIPNNLNEWMLIGKECF